MREADFVARLGGDEFVILDRDSKSSESMDSTLKRLRLVVDGPATVAGRELAISISLGTAIWPMDGVDANSLLHEADQRMYADKERAQMG